MAEYIEREEALAECDWYANEFCEAEYAIMPLRGAIRNIPSADVQPVRHGRWIEYPEVLKLTDALNDEYIGCSVCENVWNMMDNDVERFNYCPNCGAKMDGGGKQNE